MNYLYNGVELPKIPTVEGYPYAVISQFTLLYYLTLYSTPVYVERDPFSNTYKSEQVCSAVAYTITPKYGGTAWEVYEEGNATDVPVGEKIGNASSPVWSNFKLKEVNRVTGETNYLEASDPVPVPQLNPAALMQGFATMLSLRRNRT